MFANLDKFPERKSHLPNSEKPSPGGVLLERESSKFYKIHRKPPVLKSLFYKTAGFWPATLIKKDCSVGVFQ